MALADDWLAFFSGRTSQKAAMPMIKAATSELERSLVSNPASLDQIVAILNERLPARPQAKAFPITCDHLGTLTGGNVPYLLAWLAIPTTSLVSAMPPADRFAILSKVASANVVSATQTILARYSKELWDAFDRWNQLPDDWRTVDQNVFFDQLTGQYVIRAKIQKYSGDETTIEGAPNSILGLLHLVARSLQSVSSRDAFDPQLVQDYVGDAVELQRMLTAPDVGPDSETPVQSNGTAAPDKAGKPK